MHVEHNPLPLVRINCPEVFANDAFRRWLNRVASPDSARVRAFPTATWHVPGELPNETSDVFMFVDGADGSDSDMPILWWNRIQSAIRSVLGDPCPECLVWLTNLEQL